MDFAHEVAQIVTEDYLGSSKVPVVFTGYGLSGVLAILAAHACDVLIKDTESRGSCSAITFASPGMAAFVARREIIDPATLESVSIENYVMSGDLVPMSGWHVGTACVIPQGQRPCWLDATETAHCVNASLAHDLSTIADAVSETLDEASCSWSASGAMFSLFDNLLIGALKGQSISYDVHSWYIALLLSRYGMSVSMASITARLNNQDEHQSVQVVVQDAFWSEEARTFELPGLASILDSVAGEFEAAFTAVVTVLDASDIAQDFLESILFLAGTLPEEVAALERSFERIKAPVKFLAQFIPKLPDLPQPIIDSMKGVTEVVDFVLASTAKLASLVQQGKGLLDSIVDKIGISLGGKNRPTEDKSCGQEEVCLGIHPRSLDSYRDWIFPMQFTRFWDLASAPMYDIQKRKHRFILPGLYSTYAVRASTFLEITQDFLTIRHNKFLLTMGAEGTCDAW
jgi:hypothetical protein